MRAYQWSRCGGILAAIVLLCGFLSLGAEAAIGGGNQGGGAQSGRPRNPTLAEALEASKNGDQAESEARFADAEKFFLHALELRQSIDPQHPRVAASLKDLGRLYLFEGRYAEAETILKQALGLRQAELAEDAPAIGQSLNLLAQLYMVQGRYGESEPARLQAKQIFEKAYPGDDPRLVPTLVGLAALYRLEGRYPEATTIAQRAQAIQQKAGSASQPGNDSLDLMAQIYLAEGHFADAEPLIRRALAAREQERGPNHPAVANALFLLGAAEFSEGRFADAEPNFKRALAIRGKVFGTDHPVIAQNLDALAGLYRAQGRYRDAEPMLQRSLAIREKVFGKEHPAIAVTLSELGTVYLNERRLADAEPLYTRALAIREKALGPEHRLVAYALDNLAGLYRERGDDPAKIEPLVRRALAIQEKALPPNHPDIARSLDLLGALYRQMGRPTDAEPLVKRALAAQESSLGSDHPAVALTLDNLAQVYLDEHRPDLALEQSHRAVDILNRHFGTEAKERVDTSSNEAHFHRGAFVLDISIAAESIRQKPDRADAIARDSFRSAQLTQSSSAAAALAGMASRFAAGDDKLAARVRERQELVVQWEKLDAAIVEALTRPKETRDPAEEAKLRTDLDAATKRLQAVDAALAHDFPSYAELSNPQPLDVAATQALLAPDEALITYVVGPKQSWVWIVRHDGFAFRELAINFRQLVDEVKALRATLDPQFNRDFKPFPARRAFALYQSLLAPVEPMLANARNVLVVPDGALMSLPLGVLVTKQPAQDPQDLAGNRSIAWFARDHAVTVLPAVSSLRALRQFASKSKASSPFVGIGDPVLLGQPAGARGGTQMANLFRGGMADTDELRLLPPLPETADELRSVASALGAQSDALYLGERATEPLLAQADLGRYKVIEFATHGLTTGELSGLAEPALVLTPPATASPENDGLLTASKVAKLKLDADWVVLSACNTASSDGTPDAGGLSGLAKAFFHAGTRALLVSNWSISSQAAVKLTTGTFQALAKDPNIGRGEALRRSEMALLDDTSLPPAFAHPMIWAPFTLAGEGGAGR